MSYSTAKPYYPWTSGKQQWPFAMWYIDNCQNIDLPEWASPYLRNARIEWSSIKIRPWHTLYKELTQWTYPRGIWVYSRASDNDDSLIIRHNQDTNKKLVTIANDWTITEINTSTLITSDNRMSFVSGWDSMHCMNWLDSFWVLNGTTYINPNVWNYTLTYNNFAWWWANDLSVINSWSTWESHTYIIEIDADAWSPDKFKWNIDGWAYTTNVSITWIIQTLWAYGLIIQFLRIDSHVIWQQWTITTGWFSPAFWVLFNGSMWVSWWWDNPNKVYKSVADNYSNFFWTWSDVFTFQDRITGLSANNEALFYFSLYGISVTGITDIQENWWTLSYITRSLYAKEWAINHASIIETWNKTFFITPSNKICTIVRWNSIYGYEVVELSERNNRGISKIMSSLDKNQSDCFGYFLPKENLIKWFFKSNGSTIHDICIIYDITKDAFLVDWQKFFYDWIFFNGYNYTISMVESKVYIDEYWQDDEDAPISFEYWTKEYYLWDPTTRKILWETRTLIDMNLLANLIQEVWIDWKQIDIKQMWSINIPSDVNWIWTDAIWEVAIWESTISDDMFETTILRTKWNLNQKGIKFQFRFKNTSYAWKIRLKSIMWLVENLPLIATQLTK